MSDKKQYIGDCYCLDKFVKENILAILHASPIGSQQEPVFEATEGRPLTIGDLDNLAAIFEKVPTCDEGHLARKLSENVELEERAKRKYHRLADLALSLHLYPLATDLEEIADDEQKHEVFMRNFIVPGVMAEDAEAKVGVGARVRRQGEWTYIDYGLEEIRVKKSEGGLEIQRVPPGPVLSQGDFDHAVTLAHQLILENLPRVEDLSSPMVKITRSSDSPWPIGETVTKREFDKMVREIKEGGGEPPLGEEI